MHVVNVRARDLFQALADSTRLRILRLLATTREEACLCELVDSLGEPQYNMSRHLKLLRQAGLLAAEKEGRFVYHTLVVKPAYMAQLCAMVRSLPDVDGTFGADLKHFRERMRLRVEGRCRPGVGLKSSRQAVRRAGSPFTIGDADRVHRRRFRGQE